MEQWSLKNLLPFMGMVVVILSQVTILQVMKAAMSKGKNKFTIMVYSNALSIFVLLVSCIIKHRMEKLNWRSKSSQAKSIGTIVAIAGAFVITFYKGPLLLKTFSGSTTTRSNWILGGFFLASDAFLSSAWYILQALILRNFTSVLILMLFTSFFATILAAIFSLIVVGDSSAWNLKPDIGLVAVIYTAIVGALFQSSLCAWCVSKKGPIYVTTFKPLAIVLSVVMGFLLLGDALCLGSLIGAIIIVAGFYSVMWGKAKEENTIEHSDVGSLKSSSEKVPLLNNKIERIIDV
ncbi:hypothetical protein Dsin_010295 [Dipteronia sinensis]|uniref:WAT1-related protein n=1 Tax=Dipteronia sinensis TaxID=43782 RepID=A0AAE0EEA0_9ROSI|nr:hypothetical protein Dsin_010295 [Dipteronia sinensis]